MKIKILNSSTNKYIIYNIDFEKLKSTIIENKSENDTMLNIVFKDKEYVDIVNWIRARVGGKSIKECIEIAKANKLKSVTDDFLVEILD